MPLTDVAVRAAKPRERSYKLADGQGMYLEVMPNGSKYWRLKYRIGGKEKRMALGVYPAVSLLEARKAREAVKDTLRAGLDPSHEKKREKLQRTLERLNSFEAVAREWHENRKDGWSEGHAGKVLKLLERELFPSLGARPVKEVSPRNCWRYSGRSSRAARLSWHERPCRRPVRCSAMRSRRGEPSATPRPTCGVRSGASP